MAIGNAFGLHVTDDKEDGIRLVEHCARFAEQHGLECMLDLLADVHFAYAPLSNSVAVRIAYEIAGINLDGALPLQ
jgi:hypothetical protein